MKDHILKTISKFIVEKRILFFLLFGTAVIFGVLSVGKVQINSDITALLPKDTDTRRGLTIMEDEFTTFATANVMVSNIPFHTAKKLSEELSQIEHISSIGFDDTTEHYASSAALLSITFSGEAKDPDVIAAMEQVKKTLTDYEVSISSGIGQDYSTQLASEIGNIMILAVLVIIAVLLFTSKSYFEVVILLIVFAVAGVLNMGTNYWLGEISSITNSIAIILQLALAIDYAIIFCHRFQEEYEKKSQLKVALIDALAQSIIEISSSSLTTISGLFALTLMQFRLGFDLGTVLIKGILCSLITVFFLMPGLIMLFHPLLLRTRHRRLVPDISRWGRFLTKGKPLFLILFVVLMPFSIAASSLCEYAFSDADTDRITLSKQDKINQKIYATFDETNTIALLVPKGNYEHEKEILKEVSALPNIKTVTGLAGVEIEDGKMLTDRYTARAFSELVGINIETAKLLYGLYGFEYEQYQPIVGDTDSYEIPLVDILEFLFERVDDGLISLDEDKMEMLNNLRSTLEDALLQLRGTEHVRMVFNATVSVEGEDSVALVDQISNIAKEKYQEDVLVVGDITSARDLKDSFVNDNNIVSFLTIAFVFLVLLFTFRSFGAATLLVLAIQGSVWINFSFPFLTSTNVSFITYLIVVAIQMGATIDYAIVLCNRFLAHKEGMSPKNAMAIAVNESFPTILTSGVIMAAAGFIIAFMTTDLYISSIGLAIGRGAVISILLVLTVLPQLLVFCYKFMEKTTFDLKKLMGGMEDENETV